MNHHVNNARYIQWAFDTIDNDFRQRHKLTAMTVNFLGQAKLGDTYAICSASEDGETFRTAIVSAGEPQEFCRIETEWHPIEQ
jgi:acyl-ACP thioesterase